MVHKRGRLLLLSTREHVRCVLWVMSRRPRQVTLPFLFLRGVGFAFVTKHALATFFPRSVHVEWAMSVPVFVVWEDYFRSVGYPPMQPGIALF